MLAFAFSLFICTVVYLSTGPFIQDIAWAVSYISRSPEGVYSCSPINKSRGSNSCNRDIKSKHSNYIFGA